MAETKTNDEHTKTITILGEEWLIIYKKDDPAFEHALGYTVDVDRTIIVQDIDENFDETNAEFNIVQQHANLKRVLRHEIVHAFLMESGLDEDSHTYDKGWATNEEMVDWFARQAPKIYKVYKELKII